MPLPFTCLPGLLRLRLSRCTHLLEHSLHSLVYVCAKLTHLDLSLAWQVITDATATVIAHHLRCGLVMCLFSSSITAALTRIPLKPRLSMVPVPPQSTASVTDEPVAQEPQPEPSAGPDRPGATGAALRHVALPAGRGYIVIQ